MAQRWHRQKPLGRACSSARGLWPTQRPRAAPDSQPGLSWRRPPPPHADDVAAPNGRAADDATAAPRRCAVERLRARRERGVLDIEALGAADAAPAARTAGAIDLAANDDANAARHAPQRALFSADTSRESRGARAGGWGWRCSLARVLEDALAMGGARAASARRAPRAGV